MMRRVLAVLGVILILGITSALSVGAYIMTIGGSGKASQPISAPTLDMSTPTANADKTQIALLSTEIANQKATNIALASVLTMTSGLPTAVRTSAATTAPTVSVAITDAAQPDPQASTGAKLFRISQTGSQVSFSISEDLFDEQNIVTGVTDQVAGDIAIDFAVPTNSKLGIIRINARTLETDSPFRDDSIRGKILESSKAEYEFIEFAPQTIQELPDKIDLGKPVTFKVLGNLKIRDITRSVTFDITLTPTSAKIEGAGKATVQRDQFGLQIPSVPGVANVANDVTLSIAFVAVPVVQ
jgi:polyisoprenoid-binding protein YceI